MELTRKRIETWLRQAERTDWGADMSTDDQVDVLRVAIRAFDAEEEIAQLRADLAKLNRALADERAAVAIAHERIAEVTAERDARPEISRVDARRYIEWRDGFSPHPANVDRLEPVDDALRAHAAKGGTDA